MLLKMYYLDPVKFLLTSGLAWEAALNNTEVKLELLTNIDMLLIVEKGIRGGMSHVIHSYTKADNNYIKSYDKDKNHNMLNIRM